MKNFYLNHYGLLYDQPLSYSHSLLLAKADIISNAMRSTRSKKQADYLIKQLEILKDTADRTAQLGNVGIESTSIVSNQVNHIHQDLTVQAKLKENFLQPVYSEKEMEESLLDDFSEQYPEISDLIDILKGNAPTVDKEIKMNL